MKIIDLKKIVDTKQKSSYISYEASKTPKKRNRALLSRLDLL
jgi:hypothetical protein